MKNRIWLKVAVLTVLLAVVGVVAAGCTTGAANNGSSGLGSNFVIPPNILQQSGISVSGEGKVKAIPDVAVLSLGIESQQNTVTEAQQKAQAAMDAVMKALKNKGVQDKDIQTQRFSISPLTRWIDKENRQEIIGYVVSNMVTVKIRQVDNTGPVIDAVAAAGGDLTRINGISFTIDDPSALQAQAQELALKDAKTKAEAVASTLGVTLGKLTFAQTSSYSAVPPTPVFMREGISAKDSVQTPVSPGEMTIQASVSAVWGID